MPRKIPGLEEKIIASAAELFLSKGYQSVSMKDVAVLSGTSVGNLYNYFSAKKDLFIMGRRRWMASFGGDEIQKILDRPDGGTKEDLVVLLELMLDVMGKWSGLYEEFLEVISREMSPEENQLLKNQLREEYRNFFVIKMEAFLHRLSQKTGKCSLLIEGMESRLAVFLMMTVKSLVLFHKEEKEVNRQFIRNVVEVFFGEGNNSSTETSQ